MANEQNLRVPTPSEARENGKKGGKASGAARRAAKTYREAAKVLLSERLNVGSIKGALGDFFGLLGLDETSKETGALILALADFARAIKNGDEAAIQRILAASDEDGADGPAFRKNVIEVLPAVQEPPKIDEDGEAE